MVLVNRLIAVSTNTKVDIELEFVLQKFDFTNRVQHSLHLMLGKELNEAKELTKLLDVDAK